MKNVWQNHHMVKKRPFCVFKIQLKYSSLLNCATQSLCFFFSSSLIQLFSAHFTKYFLPPNWGKRKLEQQASIGTAHGATKDINSFHDSILQKSVVEETYEIWILRKSDLETAFRSRICIFRMELAVFNLTIGNSGFVWSEDLYPMEAVDWQASKPPWP